MKDENRTIHSQCPSTIKIGEVTFNCLHPARHEGMHWNRRIGWQQEDRPLRKNICGMRFFDNTHGEICSDFVCTRYPNHGGFHWNDDNGALWTDMEPWE